MTAWLIASGPKTLTFRDVHRMKHVLLSMFFCNMLCKAFEFLWFIENFWIHEQERKSGNVKHKRSLSKPQTFLFKSTECTKSMEYLVYFLQCSRGRSMGFLMSFETSFHSAAGFPCLSKLGIRSKGDLTRGHQLSLHIVQPEAALATAWRWRWLLVLAYLFRKCVFF